MGIGINYALMKVLEIGCIILSVVFLVVDLEDSSTTYFISGFPSRIYVYKVVDISIKFICC